MPPPDSLQRHAGRVTTRMGACFVGERAVFRGHDLHADLGQLDWIELYAFGITGRRLPANDLKLLHAIWVHTSYPDARIWNNRVAALAGSARSTGNLALAASLAVSEASIYGRGIDLRAIDFLQRTQQALAAGEDLAACVREELGRHRAIAGYGRPIANGDERIRPLLRVAGELGRGDGPHLRLAQEVERFLLEGRWRWKMNYAALCAALAADMGFTPREYYLFNGPAFLAGVQPCYIEASERPQATFLPLSCAAIRYEGVPPRRW